MDLKIVLESLLNAMDIGAVQESITNYRRRSWKVDPKEIFKYMLTGKRYTDLTPPQASRLILENIENVSLVDLRDMESYGKDHIKGSISKPIDDFLKEIFEGFSSSAEKNPKMVLACYTGHLSKAAAAILAEEGFTQVYSIKGGVRRWNRWMKLSRNTVIKKISPCCAQTQIP
jgi:thiosulfate sulfurtransferase